MGKHAPRSYWYGWTVRGDDRNIVHEVPVPSEDVVAPLPPGTTSNDVQALKEFSESAWQVVVDAPSILRPLSRADVKVTMGDTSCLDKDVVDNLRAFFEELYPDNPELWRADEFEKVRKNVLDKMKTFEVKEDLEEARKYVHDLLKGCPWSEEHRTDWEATVEATAGMETPLEEYHVIDNIQPTPPPGPPGPGRGSFFVVTDMSGSMSAGTGGVSNLSRFDVASAIVWTFIQEAKSVNRQGLSHYMGIYGCDSFFCYPYPYSEFPAQRPMNPMPCGNIFMVERDFLRYWPQDLGSVAGDNYWQLVFPILYDDYVKFGGGDFILIIDGDLRRDTMFMRKPSSKLSEASTGTTTWNNDAAGFYEPGWEIDLPKDPKNPAILQKLQKYMVENQCGTGYVCWIIDEWTPRFQCPDCKARWPESVQFVEIDPEHEEIVMECLNARCRMQRTNGRRLYREGYESPCAARTGCSMCSGGLMGCIDCRYMYLVLGKMFANGKHIFRGTSADRIIENIARTLTDQRTKRIIRGRTNDVMLQDGERPYDDLGPMETFDDEDDD